LTVVVRFSTLSSFFILYESILSGATRKNQEQWEQMLKAQWQLESDSVFWVKDEFLREFFHKEGIEKDESKRLSAAVGKGLF
jgi:hypothetical protein